ncbi:MAG TPA: hypothetical protein VFD08_01325 [Clostridia bacterium]|nr:hypothetical protein [Clostridia bacterium]
MKEFIGKRWGQISDGERAMLMSQAYVNKERIDEKTGGCIVQFESGLKAIGTIRKEEDHIVIDIGKEAKLYID